MTDATLAEKSWVDVEIHDTMPKVLRHNALTFGDEVALREKEYGIWNTITWRDYHEQTRALALTFAELGVGRGDVVALIGDSGAYWIQGALAAHANQALSMGVYGDVLGEEAQYQLSYAGAKVVVAEDEEQVDKLLSLGDSVPTLRHIIYKEKRGMRKYDSPRLMSLEDALSKGSKLAEQHPARYDEMIDGGSSESSALLISTSGTTAKPKFAEVAHGSFLRHIVQYLRHDPKTDMDEYVSALPLPWIMETKYVLGKSLVCRMKINFAESGETLMEDLREIGPTFLLLAPRVWEQIAGNVRARILDSTPLKRALFNWGVKTGMTSGGRSWLTDAIVFRALRDDLGFSRLSSAATGGAALGPDTYQFFIAMGVPLKQLYGQTELLGAYAIHRTGDIDFETSGVPFDGVEIKIADADSQGLGRIVTRNPNMMTGYYNSPEETSKAVDGEGWMDTGDAGYFKSGGHLVVVDRHKDLARTSGGDNFSPQYVENKLKFSPHIGEAVVFGDGRDFLSAMVCIRMAVTGKWAERCRIPYTGYADLSAREETRSLIRQSIETVNNSLPASQRLKKFVLLYKELDADDGELTRTQKVRRNVIAERYGEIIEALYSNAEKIDIDTSIQLQDGGTQRVKTVMHVEDM